jgi:ribonuclease R/exosome complex exonuclease DIS3/RRP44
LYAEIIENKCEGMIRLTTMKDDQYTYDDQQYMVVGKRSKKTYKIGDKVRIKILNADPMSRQADFEMVGE